jgi:hypothetical protein
MLVLSWIVPVVIFSLAGPFLVERTGLVGLAAAIWVVGIVLVASPAGIDSDPTGEAFVYWGTWALIAGLSLTGSGITIWRLDKKGSPQSKQALYGVLVGSAITLILVTPVGLIAWALVDIVTEAH